MKLPAYFTSTKKRLIKSPKVYIRDSGLLHYLSNIHSAKELLFNPNVGNAWEGYVIEQITQLLPYHIKPYYYRTHDGSEMDLVLVKGLKPITCIEIKTSNNPVLSRGFYESMTDLKCTNGFVVTPDQQVTYKMSETVTVCGIYDFFKTNLPKMIK